MSKSNQQYWAERELDAIKVRMKSDEEAKQELIKIYKRALKAIQNDINGFYVRYATRNGMTIQEAQKQASKMDVEEFAEQAKEYVKTRDFSDQANEELALYNLKMKISRLELLEQQINLNLCGLYDETDKYMKEKFNQSAYDETERQAGILGEATQLTDQQVMQVVNASFKVGDFSDNIWADKRQLQKNLMNTITRSITLGENPRKLASDFAKEMNTSANNAVRILRTEIGQVQIAQQKANYEENNIEYYQIIREPGACTRCVEMGNDSQTIDDAPKFKVSELVVGVNAPLFHPNCRCSTVPVVKYPY